jgi:hypothetical protein
MSNTMNRSMRRTLALAAGLGTVLSVPAGAQSVTTGGARLAPQFASYQIGTGDQQVKVSELSIPLAFAFPLTSRLSFDVATAFAKATVDAGGAKSTLSGLSDTQLRFNYTIGEQAIVLTAGINIPTGQYEVEEDKISAAGQIGNDFLAFPVSSFGNGFAGTGGIAFAHPMGTWNLGLGASVRKSAEFGAFKTGTTAFRFQPADEIRVRAGLDGAVSGGRAMFGLIYSKFGDDATDDGTTQTTYSTGDRIIGQAAFDVPVGSRRLYAGGWLLHHAAGQRLGGDAPSENVENILVALGMNAGTMFIEPNVEFRLRQSSGVSGSSIVYGGLRTKFQAGSCEVSPSIAYGVGSLEGLDLSGFKGGLTIRYSR